MKRVVAVLAVTGVIALAGCTAAPDPTSNASNAAVPDGFASTQEAAELVQVTTPHDATGGTLLEGPTFGQDGLLYVVDVMAPAGEPKVLSVDTDSRAVGEVFTDGGGAFTSAQFSPIDDRLYLTDIVSGSIISVLPDGTDPRTEFAGEVEGAVMLPDDLAFDDEGAMFVTDTRGMRDPGWETAGRVVRIDAQGAASVLADDLPSPNGISFDENGEGLWIAQYNANRIDYYGLNPDRSSVQSAFPGIYIDAGRARVDSTAVDADGHVYQAFHGLPQINVYAPSGTLEQVIRLPMDRIESATNIAIRPGTKSGYITASGPSGGFIYSFEALGEGTRQSNGG